jgi:hypothetical protein
MKKNKVAIVGFAPSTRDLAPYGSEDFEVWVLNEWHTFIKDANNITRWFELHQRETVLESFRDPNYITKLKESTIPIYMVDKFDDIPMSVKYPLDELIEKLGTRYFTNSISYMLAMAISEGYEEIHMYGVDMAQDDEYKIERPSVEFFVGYAIAKGIKFYIPPQSDICKLPYLYGFEEASAHKICTTIDPRKKDLRDRINGCDNTVDEMLEQIDFYLKLYMLEFNEEKKDLNPNISKLIQKVWNLNQTLKSNKKLRLYLSGAEEVAINLRRTLCPFD